MSIAAVGMVGSPVIANASAISPTPAITSPTLAVSVTAEIGKIAVTPGVPDSVTSTLTQLLAALNGQTPPTSAQTAALLSQLASTPGLPSQAASALDQLAGTLAPGTTSTAADLNGALSSLITQLTGSPGLPSQVLTGLTQLASNLQSPNPPGLDQVVRTLTQLAATPGVPVADVQSLQGLAASIAAAGTPGTGGTPGNGSPGNPGIPGFIGSSPFGPGLNPAGPPATGKNDSSAVRASGIAIKSVKYNAKRHTVAVVVLCKAPTVKCNTATAVYKGRARIARPAAKTIGPHKRRTFILHVARPIAAQIAKRGATLRAVAVSNTAFGRSHGTKSLHVKRTHSKRTHR